MFPSVALYNLVRRNAINDFMPVIKSALETASFIPVAIYLPSEDKLGFNPCLTLFTQCLDALEELYGEPGSEASYHPSLLANLDCLVHTIIRWIIKVLSQIFNFPFTVGGEVEDLGCYFYKHIFYILSIPEALTLFGESDFVEDATKVLGGALRNYNGQPWSCFRSGVIQLLSINEEASTHLRTSLHCQSKRLFMEPLRILRSACEFEVPLGGDLVDLSLIQLSTICSADREFQETLRQRLAPKTLVELLLRFINAPPTRYDGLSGCLLTLWSVAIDTNSPDTLPLRQALKYGLIEALATLVKLWGHGSEGFDATALYNLLDDLVHCTRAHQRALLGKMFHALEKIAEENMDGLGVGQLRELEVREEMSETLQCWVKFIAAISESGRLDPETREVKLFCMNPSCKDPCISMDRAKRCSVCSIIIVCSKVCGRAIYESGVHTHNPTLEPFETESASD